jgi:NADPH2:quinone reductase
VPHLLPVGHGAGRVAREGRRNANQSRIFGADTRKLDPVDSAKILAALVPGFEAGGLRPPAIARTSSLADGVAAYEAVATGTRGRVVIAP